MNEKLFVVDLYSGSYFENFIGHEKFNFDKKPDGMYYGYVPPKGNINVKRIDKNAKDFVDGVLVVYVQAISKDNKDREVIAFCENATVYRESQPGKDLGRKLPNREIAGYQIKSDNLTDLRDITYKHTIEGSAKKKIFRGQKSYLDKDDDLKRSLINYIKEQKYLDQDSLIEQKKIQEAEPASSKDSARNGRTDDKIVLTPSGKKVKKNAAIAKKVIVDSNYKCSYNESHATFLTSKGKSYMEGHHLIPCTVENSNLFKEKSKLDREENIVSICPTCHRAIHFGDDLTKRKLVKKLYSKQRAKLESVGLDIGLEAMLSKYLL